jgi:hypothetical protein
MQLLQRVQRFYEKRASPTDEAHKAKAVPSVEECIEIRQQWKDVDSGQFKFSQRYMTSNHFVPIWTEGLRIIKETLGSNQMSNNQPKKRNDFERILLHYETLTKSLKSRMVDAAHRGLLESEVLFSIQDRWVRLDEVVDWYYNLCNLDVNEDECRIVRNSSTWLVTDSNLRCKTLRCITGQKFFA